jgi:hypothetical protein
MGENRVAHDSAWACATALMEILEPLFRPEELADAHALFVEHIKAAAALN